MNVAALLLLIAPVLVPIWILIDSKKRIGKYSWGWAIFACIGLFGLVGQSGNDLRALSEIGARSVDLGMLWGKVAAAYLAVFWIYRANTKEENKINQHPDTSNIKPAFVSTSSSDHITTQEQPDVEVANNEILADVTAAGIFVSNILSELADKVGPGVTGYELNESVTNLLNSRGGIGGFQDSNGKDLVVVAYRNSEMGVVPRQDQPFESGDVVSILVAAKIDGAFAKVGKVVGIDRLSPQAQNLVNTAEECLSDGMSALRANALQYKDYGYAIEQRAKRNNCQVMYDIVSHEIGRELYGRGYINFPWTKWEKGEIFTDGMILSAHIGITSGTKHKSRLSKSENNKFFMSKDGSTVAQCCHTVAITKSGCQDLTVLRT